MSRGRLNIATCLVTGSIETVISVSVLWPPPCSSAPISRMFRRSLPSHGAIDTFGTGVPIKVGSGVGESVGSSVGSSEPVADGEAVGLASSGQSWAVSSPMKMPSQPRSTRSIANAS